MSTAVIAPAQPIPPAPTSPATAAELPDPAPWAGTLVRNTVEVLQGLRPAGQLMRWLTPPLYDRVAHQAAPPERRPRHRLPRRATVRRVRVCEVSPGVVEAAVILHDGAHLRAAAVRLEARRTRWCVTALQIG
ncbi:Rv3235 family protein [Bogoriella caseilytica]|uniref:Uncharacterized protein n=1 Tax=Bogoriella caseilytica TaxID=56055 RepID=A0A3N2BET0_9MICO|nr:Rv3235 family protein [Bogoriella caseilytica]ROR73749.1 hypothetical protein EDD31_2137 [Bogoriella caseilytica]